jgi:pyruvate dehydrogenase E1 component beta subunit
MHSHVPEESYAVPLGAATVRRQGTDVTVIAWSGMVSLVEEAANELNDEGVDVEVIDLRSLVPFDLPTVVSSVCKTGRLVIVQEAVRRSGFGAEIAAALIDSEAFGYLRAPIVRVANPGVPVPHSTSLHRLVIPGKQEVTAAIRRVLT